MLLINPETYRPSQLLQYPTAPRPASTKNAGNWFKNQAKVIPRPTLNMSYSAQIRVYRKRRKLDIKASRIKDKANPAL